VLEQLLEDGVLFDEVAERPADEGVLTAEDLGVAAEGMADLLQLLRLDVVDPDDEAFLELANEDLDALEVFTLPRVTVELHHFEDGRQFNDCKNNATGGGSNGP